MQGKYVKGNREKKLKPKITWQCVIKEENRKTQHKILSAALQAEMIH